MKKIFLSFALVSILAGSLTPSSALAVLTCPATIPDGAPIGRGYTAACCDAKGGSVENNVCRMPENATPREQTATSDQADTTADDRAGSRTTTTAPPASGSAEGIEGGQFVPLTTIPGVKEVTGSVDLPKFFNNLYKISVGAAAVLAVLQIVRGGMTYMLGDSITEKREAKKHITMSILGLILVLSPALVFGVINPDILNLQVDLSGIRPGSGNSSGTPGEGEGENTPGGEDAADGSGGEEATQGGDPATGCNPGYEPVPVLGTDEETCEPVPDGGGDTGGTTGGSLTVKVCVPGTSDGSNRYVYMGYSRVTPMNGPQAGQTCTDMAVETDDTTSAACRQHISGNRTTLVECSSFTAGSGIERTAPAPLCAWSERYALNSSNIDCE